MLNVLHVSYEVGIHKENHFETRKTINNHVISGGFKSIRKQMYKLYIEYQPDMRNKELHT